MILTKEKTSAMVLANCFYHTENYGTALRLLDPEDMHPAHGEAFRALRLWALRGEDLCLPSFADENPKLRPLLQSLPFEETDVRQAWWISKLKQFSWEDRSRHAVAKMNDLLSEDAPPAEKRSKLRTLWRDIEGNGEVQRRLVSVAEAIPAEMDGPTLVTGFDEWDRMVGGLIPGTIHVIAGRPGRGKTTLAMQWATSFATRGLPTLFVPLEIGVSRAVRLAKKQRESPRQAYLLDSPAKTWDDLVADFSWCLDEGQIRLVFIDHLGYLKRARKNKEQTRAEEVGDILRELRMMMRIHECVAVVVCQLNRAVEARRSQRPTLADLRESGEIEQEADSVTFLWAKPEEMSKAAARFMMSVAKARDGATGEMAVVFDRPGRRFDVVSDGVPF